MHKQSEVWSTLMRMTDEDGDADDMPIIMSVVVIMMISYSF